jgi:hypothetical protein
MTPPENAPPPYGCLDRDHHARVAVGRVPIRALMWTVSVETALVLTRRGTDVFSLYISILSMQSAQTLRTKRCAGQLGFVCRAQPPENSLAACQPWCAEVLLAEFVHKLLPQFGATALQQFSTHG